MANQNIQIGIDLGTTNSEVAINRNGNIEIVKKPGGVEYTPSVFGFDKMGNKIVGQKAYDNLFKHWDEVEEENYKSEVKRLMGTPEKVHFKRPNIKMGAEEISAEILKSLKEDILRKYPDFDTSAAVITIPAYFSAIQAEATKRAGNLAGFEYVVLLQEPIAAAMSYGFMNAQNGNWLVYDLGGGTFDIVLISSKDGVLSVLSQNGNNFLGGKDFDSLIIEKVIVPKILEKYNFKKFNKDNKSVFAKLKNIAENTKIYLSQYDEYVIEVDDLGKDDDGNEIFLSINFSKKEFEKLIKPLVDETIELSLKTIKDAGIKSSAINKIILVGGPTQIPYIRERLEKDLKVEVDSSVDPLTVVAKGACIYGLSQRIPEELLPKDGKKKKDSLHIRLNYEALTSDEEQLVAGTIDGLENDEEEYYIQFQSDSGFYNGSKIKVKKGKFFDNVALESNKTNLFWVYMFNGKGESIPVDPDSFIITHGMSVAGTPIPHSIGVGVSTKDFKSGFKETEVFERFFDKGSILPIKKTISNFKTTKKLSKSEEQNPLLIKVREGESDIPDRNIFVCDIGIKGSDLPYDLPEGSDIEITIEVNESREVFITAYIPLIDLTLNARSTVEDENIDLQQLETDLNVQSERARKLENTCSFEEKEKLHNNISSVNRSLQNARVDEDDKRKASKELKDLKSNIDQMEKEKEMPQLINDYNTNLSDMEKIINATENQDEKKKLEDKMVIIKKEAERAIADDDKSLIVRVNEEIRSMIAKVVFADPSTWVYWFHKIRNENHEFKNESEAKYYFEKGEKAIESGNVDELKRCVTSLMNLLPTETQESMKNYISGITH